MACSHVTCPNASRSRLPQQRAVHNRPAGGQHPERRRQRRHPPQQLASEQPGVSTPRAPATSKKRRQLHLQRMHEPHQCYSDTQLSPPPHAGRALNNNRHCLFSCCRQLHCCTICGPTGQRLSCLPARLLIARPAGVRTLSSCPTSPPQSCHDSFPCICPSLFGGLSRSRPCIHPNARPLSPLCLLLLPSPCATSLGCPTLPLLHALPSCNAWRGRPIVTGTQQPLSKPLPTFCKSDGRCGCLLFCA